MYIKVYSPTGSAQYYATSEQVEYFARDKSSLFQKPVVYLFNIEMKNKEQQNWKLSADSARLTKDNMLYLIGNVVAENLQTKANFQRIETTNALVNLQTQEISSNSIAKITGLQFSSEGQSLEGDLLHQNIVLKQQVKTHYEVNH